MEHEHGAFKVNLPFTWPYGVGNRRKGLIALDSSWVIAKILCRSFEAISYLLMNWAFCQKGIHFFRLNIGLGCVFHNPRSHIF
jgi:hypothetical protein